MRKQQDAALDMKIGQLCEEVEKWARRNGLWSDCGFFDYTERVRPIEWDKTGYTTVLAAEGPMSSIAITRDYEGGYGEGGLSDEFDQILDKHGFWYENYDHTEMWIYATSPASEKQFKEYMRWKWICSLIKPDFDILNQELYAHFGAKPDQLGDLYWRDYEKIIAALLESQGYQVELGPGGNDGGVDIKLLQRDPVGDILTLVQVKRYRKDRKIRLEAVQALHGASTADGAANSMFVTTSAYSPSAKRFAGRSNVPMALYTSQDVQQWCAEACNGIVEDKRRLVGEEHVARTLRKAERNHRQILHSIGGYNMVTNRFAVVLKETQTAALLLELQTQITEHDGYQQRGREVPDVHSVPPLPYVSVNRIKRARKLEGNSTRKIWDGENLYSPWDGIPASFDHRD